MSSNFVAASLGVLIIGVILYFAMSDEKFLTIAAFGFAMMVPLSTMFSPTKSKNSLLIYAIAMAVIGIIAMGQTFLTGVMFNMMTTVFIFGFIGYQWVANYFLIKEDNR
jgi:hypothetical protein